MTVPLLSDSESWLDSWRSLTARAGLTAATAAVREQVDQALATSPFQMATAHSRLATLAEQTAAADVAGHAEITLARGELYIGRGEYDEAWGQLRKLLLLWERASQDPPAPATPAAHPTGAGNEVDVAKAVKRTVDAGLAFANLTLAELELARGAYTVSWPMANEAVDALQALEEPLAECRAMRCRSRVHLGLGNTDRALKNAKRELELAEAGGQAGGGEIALDNQMLAHLTLAECERARSEFETAARHFNEAVKLADQTDGTTRARVATIRGFCRHLRSTGQSADACKRLERLQDELRSAQAQLILALVQVDLAAAWLARGNEQTALTHAINALGATSFLGHRAGEAAASHILGEIFTRLGLTDAARPRFERALDLRELVDDHLGRIDSLGGLSRLAWRAGTLEESEGWLLDALEVAEATGALPMRATLKLEIGRISRARGSIAAARERFEEALALRERLGDAAGQGAVLVEMAVLAEREGLPDLAEEHLRNALRTLTRLADNRGRAAVLIRLGELREKAADHAGAMQVLTEARALYEELGDAPGTARALKRLGDLQSLQRQWDAARELYESALPLVESLDPPDPDALRVLLDCMGQVTFSKAQADAQAAAGNSPPHPPQSLHPPVPPTPKAIAAETLQVPRDYWTRALELARKRGDNAVVAIIEGHLGLLERAAGNLVLARELLSRSATVCRHHGRREEAARACIGLAALEQEIARERRKSGDDPRIHLQKALDLFREAWNLQGGMATSSAAYGHYQSVLREVADDHLARKDVAGALRVLRISSDIALEREDAATAAGAALRAGEMLQESGEVSQAAAFFERGRELLERANDDLAAGETSLRLARMYLAANRPELVRIAAWKAKASFDRIARRGSESGIDIHRLRRASEGNDEADNVLGQLPQSPSTDLLERLRGAIERHRSGQISDAATIMRDVLQQAEGLTDHKDGQMAQAAIMLVNRVREFLVSVLRDLGRRFQEMGHTGAARSTFDEALRHFDRLGPDSLPEIRHDLQKRRDALVDQNGNG
ncbi:MAG: tetratricopeptide repeat protein [Planctomycetota bacterium]